MNYQSVYKNLSQQYKKTVRSFRAGKFLLAERKKIRVFFGQIKKLWKKERKIWLGVWKNQIKGPAEYLRVMLFGHYKNIIMVSLVGVVLVLNGPLSVTGSFFHDTEASLANIWQAAKVVVDDSSGDDFTPQATMTQTAERTVSVENTGSLTSQNQVKLTNISGDVLCPALRLTIEYEGSTLYEGDIVETTWDLSETEVGDEIDLDLSAILTVDDEELQDLSCSFDLVFGAWQQEVNLFGSAGYWDEETISSTINSGSWQEPEQDGCVKISEVYYDPDSSHGDGDDEWIELYNACSETVDLKNWYLQDNNSTEIIHQTYTFDPGQFLLVAANASLWNSYWSLVPSNAVKIALGGQNMFNNLANNGDRVELYDADDNLIDAMNYGTDTTYFSLAEPSPVSTAGRSVYRFSAGSDTDMASDWGYTDSPTPGQEAD